MEYFPRNQSRCKCEWKLYNLGIFHENGVFDMQGHIWYSSPWPPLYKKWFEIWVTLSSTMCLSTSFFSFFLHYLFFFGSHLFMYMHFIAYGLGQSNSISYAYHCISIWDNGLILWGKSSILFWWSLIFLSFFLLHFGICSMTFLFFI